MCLPEENYFFADTEKAYQQLEQYKHLCNKNMKYWLASRCVDFGAHDNYSYFRMCVMRTELIDAYFLYRSDGITYAPSLAVRPETVPKSTLILEREGRDGSKERPWICLNK